jgi:hypothetical protein
VNRENRPNTWLLRPTLQSEDSSCQPGAVHTWPMADTPAGVCHVRLSSEKRRSLTTALVGIRDDAPAAHAHKIEIRQSVQADLGRPVLPRKIFRLLRRANQWLPSARPALFLEGRFAIVTSVGRGMRWTQLVSQDERYQRGRRSRVVLASRRWCQVCRW